MSRPILLNIGSGGHRLNPPDHDEITVDLENPAADRRGSLLALPAEDQSVDVCYLSHVLEHVYRHEVPTALAECRRVLKAGGIVHIRVPDLFQVCQLIVAQGLDVTAYEANCGPIIPHDMLYGHTAMLARGELGMAHKTGFTGQSLRTAVEAAGFTKFSGERRPWELWCEGTKP